MDCRRDISTAWKTLNESKTALRHIENRLDAVAGTGVVFHSLNTQKTPARNVHKASARERRGLGDVTLSKLRPCSQDSPDKTSHSPQRGSMHESSRPGDHTHPHTSHRDTSPRAAAHSGTDVAGLSRLGCDRDPRPGSGLDGTRSSALDAAAVHYLNDSPHLETLRQAGPAAPGSEVRPVAPARGQMGAPHSAGSSPGSVSARLENLRQRRADGKLEKLRERIRRQREQLERSAEGEEPLRSLEQPAGSTASRGPPATVRKVAPAPAAPIYKGFNVSETKIRTSDGKVWGEEAFQNFSREIYRDLTHHLRERATQQPPEKERKASRPVRKIHRSASVPSSDAKPVISTSSWREGQKLVKMMLGSAPRAQSAERDKCPDSNPHLKISRVRSTARPDPHTMPAATTSSRPAGGDKRVPVATETSRRSSARTAGGDKSRGAAVAYPAGIDTRTSANRGLLSADVRGILDDLQLEGGTGRPVEGEVRRRSPARCAQIPPRLSRSASPTKTRAESGEKMAPRKRHYDTDTVRQYIARQQEDRKRKQAEQRRSQREEAEGRSQRLQELYRKQREGVARAPATPPNPVQTRLQETYTKLLLDHTLQQPRPVYQPSGESDKENKRQEPLSSSPSELSVSELRPPPLLARAPLGLGNLYSSCLHAEHQIPAPLPSTGGVAPPGGQLLVLQPESAGPAAEAHAISATSGEPRRDLHAALQVSRMERVEALKAQAARLSSRVQSEACRLARGSVAPALGPCLPDAKPQSPPERDPPGVTAPSRASIQTLLRAGLRAFGGSSCSGELPGVGLSSSSAQHGAEKVEQPHTAVPPFPRGECAGALDSSGGSISEGPLTDRSVSEGEDVLPDPVNDEMDRFKPSARKATADYCTALHNNHAHNPITVFQREAEQLAPYRSAAALQGSRPPWEELSKGSPHSVISIFAKNIHSYCKVMEDQGTATPLHAAASASNSLIGPAYEDDFSRSSSQSASKRTSNSVSNGRSEERRTRSPASHSASRRERSLERTLVEGQRNASITPDLHWNGLRKRDSEHSSVGGSHRGTDTEETLGGASALSAHSVTSDVLSFPGSPAASPGSPVDLHRVSPPRVSPPRASPPRASPPRASPPRAPAPSDMLRSSASPSGLSDTRPSPVPAPGPAPDPVVTPGRGSPMHFAPSVLQQRMSAELNYLSAVEESVRQLCDVERVRAVSLAQQESVSLAQILRAQQFRQEKDLHVLKMKAEQESLEAQRQLQERTVQMTELAHAHLVPVSPITPLFDQQRQPWPHTDRTREVSPGRAQAQTADSPLDSLSESLTSRRPTTSGGDGVSGRRSPSPCVKEDGAAGSADCRGRSSSSVEEEAHTAIDDSLHTDSIHSVLEDRADSTSVATECSVRFEESVTEDELEKSFRSLLPSESHWRDSLERGRSPLAESDEDHSHDKDNAMPFSGGQDSFSRFTMAMVQQYMREEEVRAQHQSALLRLRHRALREKTKAELAWLEHQKRRLRDKGEDDKMPPLRKRQRGLLLRLQQEQAEIRRLQEVNRSARRERQMLLQQQEEIERIQHSTLRLKEKLRSAGDTSPRSPVSGEMEALTPPTVTVTDVETRSPSPISVSGSETSSIMQKLKKMRYHTDERFLTKREQQLGRRRLQAEELLAWRQRLDAEEVAVQHMELQALAAWGPHSTPSLGAPTGPGPRADTSTGEGSEELSSPVLSVSTGPCASSEEPVSKRAPAHALSTQEPELTHSSQANCTASCSTKLPVQSSSVISEPHPPAPGSEAASDQSDVEGRVLALKAELRQRKAEASLLKKEQRQRQKERLKAQEASLLKQLESYNSFIQKTKAELSRADYTHAAKPQIKTPAPSRHRPRIKAPGLSRSEADNVDELSELENTQTLLTGSPAESAVSHEALLSSEEEPSTVTPTPVLGTPEHVSELSPEPQHSTLTHDVYSQSESSEQPPGGVFSERSEVTEELENVKSEGSGDTQDWVQLSERMLRMELHPPGTAEDVGTPAPHPLPHAADPAGGEQRNSSASSLNTDEPGGPDGPSLTDGPDLSPRKETPLLSTHGYTDDFETSLGSSLKEDHGSELTSPSAVEKLSFVSSEAEMDEELSVGSGTSSFLPQSPLGVESLPKPSNEHISEAVIPPKLLTALPSAEGSLETLKDGMPSYCVGDRVLVNNSHPGTLRFKGQISFASGFWAGVELDESEGTGDGVCDGGVYFQCTEGHGIFAPPDQISRLIESRADRPEEKSSFDDNLHKTQEKQTPECEAQQSNLQNIKPDPEFQSEPRELSDRASDLEIKLLQSENDNFVKSALDMDVFSRDIMEVWNKDKPPNGRDDNIILNLEQLQHLPITQEEKPSEVHRQEEEQTVDILDLLVSGEKSRIEDLHKSSGISCEKTSVVDRTLTDDRTLCTLVDKILDRFMCDTVRQVQQIKKVKEEKLTAANQQKGSGEVADGGDRVSPLWSATDQTDGFRTFFDKEQEEVSSPEFCDRSESPVLGPSGQVELVKRLAELELSRELLDVLSDEPDWFDEDFGLSSRKEQQTLKQRRPEQEGVVTASQQAKTPARPPLPQVKPPEEIAMLVPHTTPEVEKLVSAALQEIWGGCGLAQGHPSVAGVPKPQPSESFLCDSNNSDDEEAQCIRSYKQAVFDLSWEVVQDMCVEQPDTEQPQWLRPRRLNSVCVHRVTGASDITKVQAFVTSEVLKLCGLKTGQSQKSDWQKMLKFGRKKRDRVDHILVQELHDEEALWVNYDEDELFVKRQLADGILDALLKDTAELLIHIQEKRSKRALC